MMMMTVCVCIYECGSLCVGVRVGGWVCAGCKGAEYGLKKAYMYTSRTSPPLDTRFCLFFSLVISHTHTHTHTYTHTRAHTYNTQLPEAPARVRLFELAIGKTPHSVSRQDLQALAERTSGFSGSDIGILVRDALFQPIRLVQTATHFKHMRGESPTQPGVIVDDLYMPCSPGDHGAMEMSWTDVPSDKMMIPKVTQVTSASAHACGVGVHGGGGGGGSGK